MMAFGDHHVYCFEVKRKKEFVDFLVGKFFRMNEDPDSGIRKAFTRILHQHIGTDVYVRKIGVIWKNERYRKFGDDDIAKYTDWDNVYEVQELNCIWQ